MKSDVGLMFAAGIIGSFKFNYLVYCKVMRTEMISLKIIADNIGRVRNV